MFHSVCSLLTGYSLVRVSFEGPHSKPAKRMTGMGLHSLPSRASLCRVLLVVAVSIVGLHMRLCFRADPVILTLERGMMWVAL